MASTWRLFIGKGPVSILFLLLLLAAAPARGQDFQVTELSALGCSVVEHFAVTGDDRGGIAASSSHLFYTGDDETGRFDLQDLIGGTGVGRRYDALTSDLATGTVYSLGDGETPIVYPDGTVTVTSLLEIDGATGALTGNGIELSTPIQASAPTGIFAGYGRVVLHTGGAVYDVAVPSGEVTDLGTMPAPSFFGCESWAYWGVAEHFGGSIHLLYRQDSEPQVTRTRVPDGMTTTAAAFSDLADMCSLTVSPLYDRWYFHHEFNSQLGIGSEIVGFCRATWAVSGSADLSLTQTDSPDPVTAGSSLLYTLEVRNDGPGDATAVRVTDRLPDAADLVAAVPSQGGCGLSCDAVICDLGDLPAGAGATVTLEVIPRLAGTRVNAASVTGGEIDPDLSDNQALESTGVDAAGPAPSLLSIDGAANRLRVIDPESGATLASLAVTLAGETISGGNGLATHPLTGELWALLRLEDQDGRELVTLDLVTGAANRIGNTGDRFAGLAFDDSGSLYGLTGLGSQEPEALFVLSQTDAQPSFVLSLADDVGGEAIAFAPGGLLYHASGTGGFESVDLDGPTVTDIGTCGDPATDAAALTYLDGDVLLLADRNNARLYSIDKAGRRAVVGPLDQFSKGLAFADLGVADLALSISDAPDPVTAGETLTYTLTVTNAGPDDVPEVTVSEGLPGAFDLLSAVPSQGACEVATCGGLACSLGPLAAGAGATVSVEVTPLAAGDYVNTAIAPALGDPDPGNNQAVEATTVLPAASTPTLLSIDAQRPFLRTIDPATGASRVVSPITLPGENIAGGNGLATHPLTGELWALLRLESGRRVLVTLDPSTGVATAIGNTDLFAGLAFDAGGTLYGITGVAAQAPQALFVLSQTDASATFVLSLADDFFGQAIAFNPVDGLLYHAAGRFKLDAIDLSGPTVLPVATCTEVAPRASAMTYLGGDVLLVVDRELTGLYAVTTAGGITHIGPIRHSSKGLAFTDLPVADLSITDADAPDPVIAGGELTYTLTVTNDGPDDFPGATVFDVLPGTVSLVSAVPSQGACDVPACGRLICSLGGLEDGASATVTVGVVPLAAGSITNTATVPAFGDPDGGNNWAAETTTVLPGDSSPILLSIRASLGELVVVDPNSGASMAHIPITLAGEVVAGGNGLAAHPLTGELWALLQLAGQDGSELVTLDPATGSATRAGNTGDRFAGLAFDAGGILYGVTDLEAATREALFVLSQTDATPSFVVSLADSIGGETIAFHPEDGLLYHATGGLALNSVDLAGPVVSEVLACTLPELQVAAMTHLGRDVLLFADRFRTFYSLSTTGGMTRIGLLSHVSKGLAFIPACIPGAGTLCLPAGTRRFEAKVSYQTVQGGGQMGEARAVPLSPAGIDKGGILYFLDPDNPELLIKVLDGCGVNGYHWLFYAATTNVGFELTVTDTLTGAERTYSNPDLNPAAPVLDTRAFGGCAVPVSGGTPEVDLALPAGDAGLAPTVTAELGGRPAELTGACIPGGTTLCLPESGRFAVSLDFETVQAGGRMGEARAVPLGPLGIRKGGILYFLDGANPELLVKVLDGCAINGHYWLFYAATTNVGFELTVMDTAAETVKIYSNPDLNPAAPVLDTRAFATCNY